MSTDDDTRVDTAILGAVTSGGWDLTRQLPSPAPVVTVPDRAPAIHCPGCGETFAEAGFGGSALFLADALHAAALAAGWAEGGGRWTCSVCLAGITGPLYGPEREPAPPMAAPDSDPYDRSIAVIAEFDARVPGWWEDTDHRNSATGEKNSLRFGDGLYGFEVMFGRTPVLRSDEEAREGLRRLKAEIAERARAMHQESLERSEAEHRAYLQRLAELRETTEAAA